MDNRNLSQYNIVDGTVAYTQKAGLQVAQALCDFVELEMLPGTGVSAEEFWTGLSDIVAEFAPRNRALLEERELLQGLIDSWHLSNPGPVHDITAYRSFLERINYLLPEPEPASITTANVDMEIASLAGPQLVVPVNNARYALNAANARWGSLYDALYGTDVIDEGDGASRTQSYNPVRGALVIEYARELLDECVPLAAGSHKQAVCYRVEDGQLQVQTADGSVTGLLDSKQFSGYQGKPSQPTNILLVHHGLHIDIQIDPQHPVAQQDPAHIRDVVLESALTTIQDCEDSVAAVDVADKLLVYRNWLGLMKGDLQESFVKAGKSMLRELYKDREFKAPDGSEKVLPGRSLMLVRNVGHLMTTDAVLDAQGGEIPEGILDGLMTSAAALHDLRGNSRLRNSRAGNIYIVKPKMHGPEEVAFTSDLFCRIEAVLKLAPATVKMGIMDEERRTSLNLTACIAQAADRLIFINTGFLDRTGDEIHTSMQAGPMVRKAEMKQQRWIQAYEDRNVDLGLACGLAGRAQIGKGMWAMPDEMAAMLRDKIAHPRSGANCAWVPSPTAATLHAIHYHRVYVPDIQRSLLERKPASRDDLLIPPVHTGKLWAAADIQQELDNNAQGVLGYVVRWIDQGVGCSKVPDIHNVGLMEDRATLRISSQHIGNWLRHGVCTERQVKETLRRMAHIVDKQNEGDLAYQPMANREEDSLAFQTACELILKACDQPSGYTEPILHSRRRKYKTRTTS